MGKKNGRRNKSTASVGSQGKKNQRHPSAASETARKFQVQIDGYNAFLLSVTRLGKLGNEFTWHDIRKYYHKETQRTLTVEELNAIFCQKNMTKRDLFELPNVKSFLEPLDGTMMCRFKLIPEGIEEAHMRKYEDVNQYNPAHVKVSSSVSSLNENSSASVSPIAHQEEHISITKSIAISTEVDGKNGPTSDLSKSDVISVISVLSVLLKNNIISFWNEHGALSHQHSLQSSVTDDEGWMSGRETRSDNLSPQLDTTESAAKEPFEDDVFENDVIKNDEPRISAGSDQIDGAVLSNVLIVDEKNEHEVYAPPQSQFVISSSIEAAFEALDKNDKVDIKIVEKIIERTEISNIKAVDSKDQVVPKSPTIKKLIEKFDTPVKFGETRTLSKSFEESPKSIYAQVLEEIEGDGKVEKHQTLPMEQESPPKVIFRSTSTTSGAILQAQEELEDFVAEQKAKKEEDKPENVSGSDGFTLKEQSSLTSLDREYFQSRMNANEDLFVELGVKDCDGFTPRPSLTNNEGALVADEQVAQQSKSNESAVTSEGLITVIERGVSPPSQEKNAEEPEEENGADRKRYDSVESDADVPYSLCSEDEGEPMTMIEKTMTPPPKPEAKTRTVVVNVELDAKANREVAVDVTTPLKERIAALNAAAFGKIPVVPLAKLDSVEDESNILVLNRTEDLETSALEFKPPIQAMNEDGSMKAGRRQARFLRGGCCLVM
ncbi:unnamed protein product [Caenorhabditis bovis]|uniref:SPK domain-containing protein n=1 Tax=Caenorhabditis bovis TaxID=2654633 RepID=A0A8S1EPF0_9PELO|nr:unnamed protein product [Caenorhabditis bovis]